MEVIAKREVEGLAEEEAQEEVEDHEAPEIRKSKRLARGKAKVIHPRIPKKDLLKLDEVPRKKRKLLDTSSAAAATVRTCSVFFFCVIVHFFLSCFFFFAGRDHC